MAGETSAAVAAVAIVGAATTVRSQTAEAALAVTRSLRADDVAAPEGEDKTALRPELSHATEILAGVTRLALRGAAAIAGAEPLRARAGPRIRLAVQAAAVGARVAGRPCRGAADRVVAVPPTPVGIRVAGGLKFFRAFVLHPLQIQDAAPSVGAVVTAAIAAPEAAIAIRATAEAAGAGGSAAAVSRLGTHAVGHVAAGAAVAALARTAVGVRITALTDARATSATVARDAVAAIGVAPAALPDRRASADAIWATPAAAVQVLEAGRSAHPAAPAVRLAVASVAHAAVFLSRA